MGIYEREAGSLRHARLPPLSLLSFPPRRAFSPEGFPLGPVP
jgi:hypothetical protein